MMVRKFTVSRIEDNAVSDLKDNIIQNIVNTETQEPAIEILIEALLMKQRL